MSAKYGQNFLSPKGVKIFSHFVSQYIPQHSLVVEIGVGKGAITNNIPYKIVGYEIDPHFIRYLSNNIIIWKDFLKSEINSKYFIGNLPFYCSKSILTKFNKIKFKRCIFVIGFYLWQKINTLNLNYKVQILDTLKGSMYNPSCKFKTAIILLTNN